MTITAAYVTADPFIGPIAPVCWDCGNTRIAELSIDALAPQYALCDNAHELACFARIDWQEYGRRMLALFADLSRHYGH